MLETWPSIVISLELVSTAVSTLTDLLRSIHTQNDMAAVSIQLADFTHFPRVKLHSFLFVPQENPSWIDAMNTSKKELISGFAKMLEVCSIRSCLVHLVYSKLPRHAMH